MIGRPVEGMLQFEVFSGGPIFAITNGASAK
jgi:hypothetical protein